MDNGDTSILCSTRLLMAMVETKYSYSYLTCPRGRGRYGGRRLKMGKTGFGEEYVGRR